MRVAITHGTKGSPDINWFPWLKREVEFLGHSAIVPQYPTPGAQNLDNWLSVFDENFGFPNLTDNCVLVGHSIAVPFMLHVLREAAMPIRACFFISGFLHSIGIPEYDELNKSFIKGRFDWINLQKHAGRIFVYHSENDPYVPLKYGQEIAENLGVSLTLIPGGGHLNSESGFTSFPKLLADLKTVLN